MQVRYDLQEIRCFFSAPKLQVVVSVYFDDDERAVIDRYGLHDHIVWQRRPIVYFDDDGRQEIDQNVYVRSILDYAYVQDVASPTAALGFEQEMQAALADLKQYLDISRAPYRSKVYQL
ncbi:MAG TPA: hypothetical protein VFA65_05505 [Bryobacteraceae bacterium]|nr:hypothetical protein [Bryobacteraceae bacterium]